MSEDNPFIKKNGTVRSDAAKTKTAWWVAGILGVLLVLALLLWAAALGKLRGLESLTRFD